MAKAERALGTSLAAVALGLTALGSCRSFTDDARIVPVYTSAGHGGTGNAGTGDSGGAGGSGPTGSAGSSGAGSGGVSGTGGNAGASSAGASSAGMSGGGTSGSGGEAGTSEAGGAGTSGDAGTVHQVSFRSCVGLAQTCGDALSDDCCTTATVTGGSFTMGNVNGQDGEFPEHTVSVLTFDLDLFEVTAGRFRAFLNAYDAWHKPVAGDGAIPSNPDSGWKDAWTALLPASASDIESSMDACTFGGGKPTWKDTPNAQDQLALNCLGWLEAYAFCLWDGGRLPSEAEWEFAARGGSLDLAFPWGNAFNASYANCANIGWVTWPGQMGHGLATGHFGQSDMIGNVWEWTRDLYDKGFYGSSSASGSEPLNPFDMNGVPALRGASWAQNLGYGWTRSNVGWDQHNTSVGVRCARETGKIIVE